MPGRRNEEKRKNKRAAETCQSITKFFKSSASSTTSSSSGTDGSGAVIQSDLSSTTGSSTSSGTDGSGAVIQSDLSSTTDSSSGTDGSGAVIQSDQSDERNVMETGVQVQLAAAESRTKSVGENLKHDLGEILSATMSVSDIKTKLSAMSDDQKYTLLKHHSKPCDGFIFPSQYEGGCNRSFQRSWLDSYPWLIYSKCLDGAFCIYCALFASPRDNLGILVNKPFTKWRKKSEYIGPHAMKGHHIEAQNAAMDFIAKIDHPEKTVEAYSKSLSGQNYQNNLHILRYCVEAVLFCGRQCIALRTRNESGSCSDGSNPGNFIALLRSFAQHDDALLKHLTEPAQKNATYTSSVTQNQIIEIIGKDIIQRRVVEEIEKAKFFSILADEVDSHNREVCSLCIRFVDAERNIREEFVDFVGLVRTTGEHIASAIKKTIENVGLDIQHVRGQGYDGCSAMSSEAVGVQAIIKRSSPKAQYVHCYGHCLNLVIAHSCRLTNVRNVLDILKETCLFFLHSPKRTALLQSIVQNEVAQTSKRKAILDLCKTRWAMRHVAYSHFYSSFVFIVKTLEVIAYSLHQDSIPTEFTSGWDTDSKAKASSLLRALCSFDFIVTFLVVYKMLSHLSGITVKLQGKSRDILQAFSDVEEIKHVYSELRANVDQEFQQIYDHAKRMASAVEVEPSRPRITGRQTHRSNIPIDAAKDDVESYYLRNLVIPFLDNIVMQLSERFSDVARQCAGLLALVPTNRESSTANATKSLKEAVTTFQDDLPNPELVDGELLHWKVHWEKVPDDKLPKSAAQCLKKCDATLFPNIFTLLKLLCTLPTTSCECERTFSALRRLNTYNRCSMTQERMSSLALIHIHYDKKVDVEEVVRAFCQKQPRRMYFGHILKDSD
ncbi:52 kDa repressor of the inhibitor of the protein kinase-like [Diadema setosum]|uniref:52 kDa repressor of the inhibitor of the protein kinase-like n=1 Tax=Diadema setosum TaxID=31175 RepID=UPI003B3BB451